MESIQCREFQLREFSEFIKSKTTKNDDIEAMNLICGDFNVNSLPETEDVKNMILRADPLNQKFLDLSHVEYPKMFKILQGEAFLDDVVLCELGCHPQTFQYFNTCREMNKREEFQVEINQCFDYVFQKHTGSKKSEAIFIKPGSLKVESFESHNDKPFPAVSDHKGISLEIEVSQSGMIGNEESDSKVIFRQQE